MTIIRHHRRHHSWPHCGSQICTREICNPQLRGAQIAAGSDTDFSWTSYPNPSFHPLDSGLQDRQNEADNDIYEDDDAEMAGITRMQSPRLYRLWSRSLARNRRDDLFVSPTTIQARKPGPRGVLRRLIRRPPLDKSRSLFVMPTFRRQGEAEAGSGRAPSRVVARPVTIIERVPKILPVSELRGSHLVGDRRHRRCHSEQPRSWREPSASLWPLQEES
ncbi:hypothetical protein N7539_006220 [Penicillium diatomitis]|uniref:Uncharacterized protein n=1 Tax=Penicillium diatomitis TaxID=2819901 RepID=A0A9W9X2Q4_9EURO|nr:uncharacterized protein N7539_006220 [Penicillium diatomitis]KAJ5482774.1 hypothetical protein N7539_006220 [Penicillium diatomitis]